MDYTKLEKFKRPNISIKKLQGKEPSEETFHLCIASSTMFVLSHEYHTITCLLMELYH